jgi:3'-phosphoadenosine 5'-phosphosulfate synthase
MVESSATPSLTRVNGATYWLTGYSGAGKSTLAEACKAYLDSALGNTTSVFCLDGDHVRQGMNKNLGFSPEDRAENVRRVGEVSKLFNQAGQIVFCSFISPEAAARQKIVDTHAKDGLPMTEVFVCPSFEECEKRDPKGLYKKARAGQMKGFTGVDAPYDEPQGEHVLRVDTLANSLEASVQIVINDMIKKGIVRDSNRRPIVNTLVVEDAAKAEAAAAYPKLALDTMQTEFLQTIGEGWAYPLNRFMNEMELLECLQMKTLTVKGERHLMSCPITQHCTKEFKEANANAAAISLTWNGKVVAVINGPQFFDNRHEEICTRTFGCFEKSHPMAENIVNQGEFLVSGESMDFISHIKWDDGLD